MSTSLNREALRILLSRTFGLTKWAIGDDHTLASMGADSLDLSELELDIEEEFKMCIGLSKADTMESILRRIDAAKPLQS
jgi:acyl carrier protein